MQQQILQTTTPVDGNFPTLIEHPKHEFVLPTKAVAEGYGVSPNTIRSHLNYNKDEFKEETHFIRGVRISNTLANAQPHAVYWTKKGIVRLGFFIKSERAVSFRNWAEGVVVKTIAPATILPAVRKRKHNRLTNERLVKLMPMLAEIDNKDLRIRLTNELLNG